MLVSFSGTFQRYHMMGKAANGVRMCGCKTLGGDHETLDLSTIMLVCCQDLEQVVEDRQRLEGTRHRDIPHGIMS